MRLVKGMILWATCRDGYREVGSRGFGSQAFGPDGSR